MLRLTSFALYSDAVLGGVYGKSLLAVEYTWGQQLPVGALAAALVGYGVLSAFAAPTVRWLALKLFPGLGPYRSGATPSGRDFIDHEALDRLGLLGGNTILVERAAQLRRGWDEADRVRGELLLFGTLLLITQFLVPTSLVASLGRFAWSSGAWLALTPWLTAALGVGAAAYGLPSAPAGGWYTYMRAADQRLLEPLLEAPPQPRTRNANGE